MADDLVKDLRRRMDGALEVLRKEFAGLRTGRASVSLLDPVLVEAYGARMPVNQVASVSAPEARLLTVQVWDKSLVNAVEKAIRNADLGLNPQSDGQTLRVPIPQLDEERRVEITRIAGKYAEQTKVAVRNVRRDGNDRLKRLERDGEISQDELHHWTSTIQELTDAEIDRVDELLDSKQTEIMQV